MSADSHKRAEKRSPRQREKRQTGKGHSLSIRAWTLVSRLARTAHCLTPLNANTSLSTARTGEDAEEMMRRALVQQRKTLGHVKP